MTAADCKLQWPAAAARRLIFLLILAAAGGVLPLHGAAEPSARTPTIEAIRIHMTGKTGDSDKMERIARGLIDIKAGQPFSEQALSSALAALKRSGLFAAIHVPDPDWEKAAVTLDFHLKPFVRIKEIQIKGGFPLRETEIRNVMSITVGDSFSAEALSAQEKKIARLFSEQGYIRPRVSASAKKDPADGHRVVHIDIRKGPFYHLDAVHINGNTAFSDFRLKMRLDTWQSSKLWGGPSRFTDEKLKEDMKTLRQFYRGKGYCEVRMDSKVEKNKTSGSVTVAIAVKEGPKYAVDFSGNQAFWDFSLKKDLVLFTEGNPDGFGLRKSLRKIREHYRQAGFLDVRVRTHQGRDSSDKGGREITIAIDEGPRYIVETVAVSGNRAFSDERIKKQMLTAPPGLLHAGAYVPETLEDDSRAIKAFYLKNGYRRADIRYRTKERPASQEAGHMRVRVSITIEEGPQTLVQHVGVKGAAGIGLKNPKTALSMKAGDPFRQFLVKSETTRLAARISEKGYPHVKVTPRVKVSADDSAADIVYQVRPGPYTEMGQAFFTGNFKTRRRVLAREMTLSAGDAFSLSEMLASQRNIRSLNAVSSARFKTFGLAEKEKQVDMLAGIQEIRPYFVEFAAGYDTRRLFYINLSGGNSNLMGLNKELRGNLEWSQIGHRAELGLFEPRFFGTRVKSSMNLYTAEMEEPNKDFGVRTHGASLGLSRNLFKNMDANLNFQFESREQYRTDDRPIPEEEKKDYEPRSILVTTPSLAYNSTDSFVRPTRGVRASLSVDVSQGLKNSLDDFYKYRLDGRYYYSPLDRLTLAAHGRVGYIDPFGEESRIPDDQLFFLGGIADVRGFSENRLRYDAEDDPVGGRTHYLASLEARYDLGMGVELGVFYDTGAVRDALTDAGSDDFRSSAGLALRYITPIGPVGGMYGWKLDRKPGEDPGAFHFAIGYTF
jgi:outer membrane protein insertion porin family